MSKRQGRRVKQSCKRPTLAQQNMALKAEVESLLKERKKLMEEKTTKTGSSELDITKISETLMNNFESVNTLTTIVTSVTKPDTLDQFKATLLRDLAEIRMQNMELENNNRKLRDDQYKKICIVCLSKTTRFGIHTIVSLPCGHVFGRNCITKWLRGEQLCPKCRQSCLVGQMRRLRFDL